MMKFGKNTRKLFQAYERAEKIKPLAVKNGSKIVSFEDALLLNQLAIMEGEDALCEHKMNPDGSYARIRTEYVSINPEMLFNNRYRSLGKGVIQVVTDYRALKEQNSGIIYSSRVVAFEIKKRGNKYTLNRVVNVSADEFIAEFTHKLGRTAMANILPLISERGGNITEDSLDEAFK